VGQALRPHLPSARFLDHAGLDVTDAAAVRAVVAGCDVVIHLAAMTHVDACETNPELARRVNDEGTSHVTAAAAAAGAKVIYTSTDYVFDGTKTGEYLETDAPRPLNVYGATKLAGERHVRKYSDNLAVRTSWVIGKGRNFVGTMLAAARQREVLTVVDDQRGRPTFASDLGPALLYLIDAGASGLLHVAGDGPPCSWADLAEAALAEVGSATKVERVTTEAYRASAAGVVAERPRNSVLCLDEARHQGVPLRNWHASLSDYLRRL
jgi:dTDP-4-dehydrorhamnose reductase